MSSENEWLETPSSRWDFATRTANAETPGNGDCDVGYEAALPGLQALFADAAELRSRAPRADDH